MSELFDPVRPLVVEATEEDIDMSYVDGFIVAVPKANIEAYKDMARQAGDVWMEHGALSYAECLGDDVPYGEVTSFPRAVQAREDETVVFSWITYKSRADRDAIVAKVMEDPRLQGEAWRDVFDGKRMIYGGFEAFLEK
ncbi:uncharacterized protein YbaA (DUF1428 family) [Ensifer adhaerens]|uniref:Uncharacterized protein YbaA (DUF1428 family) n=1 Tax=Ensifer adhaerens TaxID=106592 RepID=A0ACC5SXP5_ENSAD|nr:uncharacterized protein YbaA (DUF1428 family) [Ensifer adhaerens]